VPAPAASVILTRNAGGNLEVYLTRRRPELRFLAGFTVFPGGRVDAEDLTAADKVTGLGRRHARRLLKLPARLAAAHWVAAFRELHEEVGLWLGEGPSPTHERWHAEAGALPASRLLYVDHWITPPWVPVRFNTRFFVTEVPPDVDLRPHDKEIDEAAWMRPAEALARIYSRRMLGIRPTIKLLELLAAFRTTAAMHRRWRAPGFRVTRGVAEWNGKEPMFEHGLPVIPMVSV
jgi:8-oxo-dGTP pyrophosphatase MutT (NUDIX family)